MPTLPPQRWDYRSDVIVVGAGGAGLTAAMSAHDAGAKALVMDRMRQPGGDTRISLGGVYAAGTSVQKALGVEDSADRMYRLYMAACPRADELEARRMRIIAEGSADAIEWLIGLGVEFPAVMGIPGLTYTGIELLPEISAKITPVPGSHTCVGKGQSMHDVLLAQTRHRGIEVLTETRAKRLITDAMGNIIGVKAEAAGKPVYIKARRSVVICSGHFAYNNELVGLYVPEFVDMPTFTAPGLEGDGLLMAQAIGAAVSNISDIRANLGVWYEPIGRPVQISRWYACIVVNKKGKRFMNDHAGYNALGRAVLQQPDKVCFVIFDESVRQEHAGDILMELSISKDLSREIKSGLVKTASSIGKLAQQSGIDPGGLEATLAKFNKNARLGKDPEFGRTHFLQAIEKPPFYAVEGMAVRGVPSGGIKTDHEARVINVFGEIIPRLFSVGSVTSLYKDYPGGGSSLANVFVYGRIAGKNAAREAYGLDRAGR